MDRNDERETRPTVETIKGDTHDGMPLGDRVASRVKEAGHDLKADYDKTKRDVRDDTD